MKLSPIKKKKKKAITLYKVEKLLKGTRLRVEFSEGQYYFGKVICSIVRSKPLYRLIRIDRNYHRYESSPCH